MTALKTISIVPKRSPTQFPTALSELPSFFSFSSKTFIFHFLRDYSKVQSVDLGNMFDKAANHSGSKLTVWCGPLHSCQLNAGKLLGADNDAVGCVFNVRAQGN